MSACRGALAVVCAALALMLQGCDMQKFANAISPCEQIKIDNGLIHKSAIIECDKGYENTDCPDADNCKRRLWCNPTAVKVCPPGAKVTTRRLADAEPQCVDAPGFQVYKNNNGKKDEAKIVTVKGEDVKVEDLKAEAAKQTKALGEAAAADTKCTAVSGGNSTKATADSGGNSTKAAADAGEAAKLFEIVPRVQGALPFALVGCLASMALFGAILMKRQTSRRPTLQTDEDGLITAVE